MGRKKQFIDKKSAQHFHVVHRSQRDPKANDPEASKYVLLSSSQHVELRSDSEDDDSELDSSDDDEMPDLIDTPAPSSQAKATSKPSKSKSKAAAAFSVRKVRFGGVVAEDLVDENGMQRDGYDYSQHLKEMGHGGKFYSATARFDAPESARALSRKVDLPEDALPSQEEQERLLDAITLTTDVMDEDLREALVNDEAFEELNDDFVVQAAEEDVEAAQDDGFDYDAHIAKLMEAAAGVTPLHRGNLTDDEDDEELSDEEGDELSDAEDASETQESRDEKQRVLDALFEKTMAEEYEDEQVGELEEDDPATRGEETLDGALLAAVVEDFAAVKQEIADAEGKLGNPLRSGNRLQQVLEECEAERFAYEYDEDAPTDEEEDPAMSMDPAVRAEADKKAAEELVARNTYLARQEREQWDCETIVSTYSTLDNHPTLLREEAPARRKKKKASVAAAAAAEDVRMQKITLSRKTGMPQGVFETEAAEKSRKDKARADEGARRKKQESKEEKRARKAAVKQDKMARRAEKKETKLAFKEEEARQSGQTLGGRVSVFKY